MAKIKIPPKLKCHHKKADYQKVFETPLEWCPLFGYLPDVDEPNHNLNNKSTRDIVSECKSIIEHARFHLGVADNNMVKYARSPNVKELIFIYHDFGPTCKAIRTLFKNLDYLALKAVSVYDHPSIVTELAHCGNIAAIQSKTIGRISNAKDNCFSVMAKQIRIDKVFPVSLLSETKKLTNQEIDIDQEQLLYLYVILETWLVLTSLFFKTNHQTNDFLYYKERLIYANDLFNIADRHVMLKEKNQLYYEKMILDDKNTELEETAKPLIKEKNAQRSRMKEISKLREKQKGILLATTQLEQEHPKLKNAEKIYRIIFNKYRADAALVQRLCDGEDVDDSFLEVSDDIGNIYHVFMIPDNVEFSDPLQARLHQIINTEEKKNNRGISFNTYRTEYFRGGKKHKGGKAK